MKIHHKTKKKIIEILNIYRKEHKKDWFSFARGIMIGYTSNFPRYEEAKLSDFEEWIKEA